MRGTVNINNVDKCWFAIQVRPRHELVTSTILHAKGYEEFVPLYRSKRQWSDRKKVVDLPLFAGYVFCRFDATIQWPIVSTAGVIRIVGTRNGIAMIEDREIEAIQTVAKCGMTAEPCIYPKVGDLVRVADGPLAGHEGLVTQYKNNQRFIITVNLIQSSIAVEVDGFSLVPIAAVAGTVLAASTPTPHS